MTDFNFNDSSIVNFYTKDHNAILEVDDVHYNHALVKVIINVRNYKSLQADNGTPDYALENIEALKDFPSIGEVLDFKSDEVSFTALIEWQGLGSNDRYTRTYKIIGQSLSIDIGEPYIDTR